jgi:3'-phosphoadenosine 5'-phosphosulfate sulfotransferase (PAPS reductase)/FAD synthetase
MNLTQALKANLQARIQADAIRNPSPGMKPFIYPKRPLKDRISISFSGGKTSAYMTKMLLDHFRKHEPWREIIVTFANTGQEHEETLKFVDRCDKAFGFGVVWLEAVVNPERGKGIRHKIVSFETAARNGEPFEAYIAKHGIPNRMYNQCTSRLKTEPMDSFRVEVGWSKDTFSTAIGIRADEIDRVSMNGIVKWNLFYPCADAGVTKDDVREWWASQNFNLNIPEHWGNCVWCWKKSNRKLLTLAKNNPAFFDFPKRMEATYALAGGERRDGEARKPRKFFRGEKTSVDLLLEAQGNFTPFEDDKFIPFDDELDVGGACGDSCEIYSDQD